MGVVGGAVIQALVAVEGRIGHRQQGGGGAQAEPAKGAPAYPAGQKENGEQETQVRQAAHSHTSQVRSN